MYPASMQSLAFLSTGHDVFCPSDGFGGTVLDSAKQDTCISSEATYFLLILIYIYNYIYIYKCAQEEMPKLRGELEG